MKAVFLIISLLLAHHEKTIQHEYVITNISEDGYFATGKDGFVFIDKKDFSGKIGQHIKVTYTKSQYETMEGYKNVK